MTNYEFASGMLKDFGDVTEEYLESYYGMKGIFDVKDDDPEQQRKFEELEQLFNELVKATIEEVQRNA